jgi:hypothetical protein
MRSSEQTKCNDQIAMNEKIMENFTELNEKIILINFVFEIDQANKLKIK